MFRRNNDTKENRMDGASFILIIIIIIIIACTIHTPVRCKNIIFYCLPRELNRILTSTNRVFLKYQLELFSLFS